MQSADDVSTEVIVALVLVSAIFCLTLAVGIAWLRKLQNTLKVIPERYAAQMDAALAEKDQEVLELQRERKRFAEAEEKKMKERKNRGRVVLSEGAQEYLEEQEMRRLRRLFYEFDADGSGALDREEIASLTAHLGGRLTEQELDEAMYEMDDDGSGDVDFEEFHEWYAAARSGGSKAAKLAKMLTDDKDNGRTRRGQRGKGSKRQSDDAPPAGGRYIRGVWVPDSVGPFDVTGLWEAIGTNTDDDETVTEHVWLEQADDGTIVGNDVDAQGQRTDDPYVVERARWDGYTLSFTQRYPDGASTQWKAKVVRDAEGHLVMLGGQWSGDCNGFFGARILSGEVTQPLQVETSVEPAGAATDVTSEGDGVAGAAVGPSPTKLKFQRGVNLAAAKAMLAKEMKGSGSKDASARAAAVESAVEGRKSVASASTSTTKLKFQRGVNLAAAKAMLAKEMKGSGSKEPMVRGQALADIEVEGRKCARDVPSASNSFGVEGRRHRSADNFGVEGKRSTANAAAAVVPAARVRRKGSIFVASTGPANSRQGPLSRQIGMAGPRQTDRGRHGVAEQMMAIGE